MFMDDCLLMFVLKTHNIFSNLCLRIQTVFILLLNLSQSTLEEGAESLTILEYVILNAKEAPFKHMGGIMPKTTFIKIRHYITKAAPLLICISFTSVRTAHTTSNSSSRLDLAFSCINTYIRFTDDFTNYLFKPG